MYVESLCHIFTILFVGFYDYFSRRGYTSDKDGQMVLYKTVIVSGIGGVIGHVLANPFYLVKTHFQTQSAKAIAVGHQHHHDRTFSALKNIIKAEGVMYI